MSEICIAEYDYDEPLDEPSQNLQGCLVDNGDDTYDASGCKIWCRTGTIRVADAYGVPGIVLSSPHFLYGDADIYNEVGLGSTQLVQSLNFIMNILLVH